MDAATSSDIRLKNQVPLIPVVASGLVICVVILIIGLLAAYFKNNVKTRSASVVMNDKSDDASDESVSYRKTDQSYPLTDETIQLQEYQQTMFQQINGHNSVPGIQMQNDYQLSYMDGDYGNKPGTGISISDKCDPQEVCQEQHHYRSLGTNGSELISRSVASSCQPFCVKYSATNSPEVRPDCTFITSDNSECCHLMTGSELVQFSSPNIVTYVYSSSSPSLSNSSTSGPMGIHSPAPISYTRLAAVDPTRIHTHSPIVAVTSCDNNCLTVIQELENEQLWSSLDNWGIPWLRWAMMPHSDTCSERKKGLYYWWLFILLPVCCFLVPNAFCNFSFFHQSGSFFLSFLSFSEKCICTKWVKEGLRLQVLHILLMSVAWKIEAWVMMCTSNVMSVHLVMTQLSDLTFDPHVNIHWPDFLFLFQVSKTEQSHPS